MSTYTVHARRWSHGWELHIDGMGVTQSRNLGEAERTARDYIETVTDQDAHHDDVVVIPELGDGLDEAMQAARNAVADADRERHEAAAQVRQVVRDMKRAGLSGRDIAHLLNVSAQRVSQFLKSSPAPSDGPASARLTVLQGGNKAPRGSRPSSKPLEDVSFLIVADVASIMSVSKVTVYRLVHSGELEAFRVGRAIRIPDTAVREYMRSRSAHAV